MKTSLDHSELIILDVDLDGTIIDPTVLEPRCRADVIPAISLWYVLSVEDLVDEIEQCEPLVWHFRRQAQVHALGLGQRTQRDRRASALIPGALLSPSERLILRALREHEDDGWQKWIEFSGDGHLKHFKSIVEVWLASDIDWAEEAHFKLGYSGQNLAKLILEDLPMRTLDALGVVIVDGRHPGSTYSEAQLRKSVREANEVAQLLKLAIRFSEKAKLQCEVASPAVSAVEVLA